MPLITRDTSEGLPNDSLHAAVLGTTITCLILVTAFTSARLTAKRSVASFNIEDYLLMITWPLLLGFVIAFITSANYGVGEHDWNVAPEQLPHILKADYVIDIFFSLTTWCAKTALLFQMQRIFCPTNNGLVYIACYVLMASVAATYSVITLCLILQCLPVRKVWDPTIAGHCLNFGAMSNATGVINVVTDFLILALPIWAISNLKMPLKKKFTISAIFGTGLLACACSLCRMVYSFEIFDNGDVTYNIARLGISAVCELTSIVLCTCFPLMPRFVQVCKSTDRGSQFFSLVLPRSSPSSLNRQDGKTLNEDSCVFCDKNATCAVHKSSTEFSKNYIESGNWSGDAMADLDKNSHRDSDATEVESAPNIERKPTDIMVHQRFEVEHGVQLNDRTDQQTPGI